MTGPKPYPSVSAVPPPPEDELREVLGDGYDPATTLNVVQMAAGTRDMFPAFVGFVKAVFAAEGVDPRLRQMIILRAATVLDVPYEWQANVPMSLNNGLTQAHVDAAGGAGPVSGVEPEYVLACRAADEMFGTGTLTDDTRQALLDRFGATATRKIILIIAWFSLLSLFLNGTRVPMETVDKIGTKRSPLE